jgi:hypothetical protein
MFRRSHVFEIVEATIYLPVSISGALLYLGDGHAGHGPQARLMSSQDSRFLAGCFVNV